MIVFFLFLKRGRGTKACVNYLYFFYLPTLFVVFCNLASWGLTD